MPKEGFRLKHIEEIVREKQAVIKKVDSLPRAIPVTRSDFLWGGNSGLVRIPPAVNFFPEEELEPEYQTEQTSDTQEKLDEFLRYTLFEIYEEE